MHERWRVRYRLVGRTDPSLRRDADEWMVEELSARRVLMVVMRWLKTGWGRRRMDLDVVAR